MPDELEQKQEQKHPGGMSMTKRLLELAGLAPCRILDMGAGAGQAVAMLQRMGYDAIGIDKTAAAQYGVLQGDFLHSPFDDHCFDAILSECAFYCSGDPDQAVREAARLLKQGGTLLLADVTVQDAETHRNMLEAAGFALLHLEDITPLWKEYYIAHIWDGTVEQVCGIVPKTKGQTYRYYLTICERM